MIKNISREKKNLIDVLNESPFDFYLTGSRFFGGYRVDSDWDFFCEKDPDIRVFLEELGFYLLCADEAYSGDLNTAYVLRFKDETIQIDIQMQNNINRKINAQNRIKKACIYFPNIKDKSIRKLIWNVAYQD